MDGVFIVTVVAASSAADHSASAPAPPARYHGRSLCAFEFAWVARVVSSRMMGEAGAGLIPRVAGVAGAVMER